MRQLKEAFINKNTIKNISICNNKFGITEKDLIGELVGFPIGVVVRMLEEQKLQGNKPDVTVFQRDKCRSAGLLGFDWDRTKAGYNFWSYVISGFDYDEFYKKYPEYKNVIDDETAQGSIYK